MTTEREGPPFRLERGVHQRDPISPKLFTSLLEDVIREMKWGQEYGISLNEYRLANLRFADIVLFANKASDLEAMLQDLSNHSTRVGQSMNMSKTKVMTNR